jgi:glycosyltransferase involved in cell wall biosynthesis
MSTYNGAEYLEEQLDSIRMQTMAPDEVIISDDCSDDGTVQLIRSYIARYQLHHWYLQVNKKNKGWKKNFMSLLSQASGAYIFLADQDDIWELDKIEKMVQIMEQNLRILLLASNYTPFYMVESKEKKRNETHQHSTGEVRRYPFGKDFLYVRRPGCVYCVRKTFAQRTFRFWFDECPHDALLWRLAMIEDGLYLYEQPMIRFRRHDSNASSVLQTGLRKKQEDVNYYIRVLQEEQDYCREYQVKLDEKKHAAIRGMKKHLELRKTLLERRSIRSAVALLGYLRYYYSPKTYLGDLYAVFRKKNFSR